MVSLKGTAQDEVYIDVDIDDIHNALSTEEEEKLFWLILENIWNSVKDTIKEWVDEEFPPEIPEE